MGTPESETKVSEPEDIEDLGSEMHVLAKIIKEASKTKKRDAIVRGFSRYDPDNLEKLASFLAKGDLPKTDIYFILENWGAHRDIKIPFSLKKKVGGGKKALMEAGDDDEEKKDPLEEIAQMGKDQLMAEAETLKEALKLKTLQNQLVKQDKLMKKMEQQEDDGGSRRGKFIRRVTHKPKMDSETGDFVTDKKGNVIQEQVVEEIPIDSYGQTPMAQGGGDPYSAMAMMTMNMFKMMKEGNQSQPTAVDMHNAYVDGMNLAMEKLKIEGSGQGSAEIAALSAKLESSHQMEELKQELGGQVAQLHSALEKRELTREFGGIIGKLQDKIDEMEHKNKQSDSRYKIEKEEELVRDVKGDVREELVDLKKDVRKGMDDLANDMIEERRQGRAIKRLKIAKSMGIAPEDVQKAYETTAVPEVTDAEMEDEMDRAGYSRDNKRRFEVAE